MTRAHQCIPCLWAACRAPLKTYLDFDCPRTLRLPDGLKGGDAAGVAWDDLEAKTLNRRTTFRPLLEMHHKAPATRTVFSTVNDRAAHRTPSTFFSPAIGRLLLTASKSSERTDGETSMILLPPDREKGCLCTPHAS